MSSEQNNNVDTSGTTASPPQVTSADTKRKVSILTTAETEPQAPPPPPSSGHDNLAFQHERSPDQESPSRSISVVHHPEEPTRKKSILHNPLTLAQQAQQLSQIHNVNEVEPTITQQPTTQPTPYRTVMNSRHMIGEQFFSGLNFFNPLLLMLIIKFN